MLDPLARSQQSPGQHPGLAGVPGRRRGDSIVGRAVRYHEDLLGVRAIDIQQSGAARLRHRDDRAGGGRNLIEDQALARRGPCQHRMQHHDARHVQGFEQRNYVPAVGAAVNPVLVLQDYHIEVVHYPGRSRRAHSAAIHEIVHDISESNISGRHRLVEHPHDGYLIAWPGQMGEQGSTECRQPALRGGIGAEQHVSNRHEWLLIGAYSDKPRRQRTFRSSARATAPQKPGASPDPRRSRTPGRSGLAQGLAILDRNGPTRFSWRTGGCFEWPRVPADVPSSG